MKSKQQLQKMVLVALCLALAFVLPFFTGNNPEIGSIFCLLHLPVLLAGFLCGGYWGLAVGFTSPLLRSLIAGMPPLFPTAVAMSFELATYGLLAGLLYAYLPKKNPLFTSLSLPLCWQAEWFGAVSITYSWASKVSPLPSLPFWQGHLRALSPALSCKSCCFRHW